MNRFRYARDPLCLIACALYVANRLALKPHLHSGFLHDHFDDLLLIPAALPFVLWIQRRLGVREHDVPPTTAEIILHLVIWSLLAEAIIPLFSTQATADPIDAFYYLLGALLSALWWHRPVRTTFSSLNVGR